MLDQPEIKEGRNLAPVLASLSGDLLPFLFREASSGQETRVYIGEDLPSPGLKDCALVVSPFHGEAKSRGFIAVFGPRRMSYGRVIPLVRYAASVLSEKPKS